MRFIEAFVDQCDLQAAGFRRVQPNERTRVITCRRRYFEDRLRAIDGQLAVQ